MPVPTPSNRATALWSANRNLAVQEGVFLRLRAAAGAADVVDRLDRDLPAAGAVHVFPASILTRRAWAAELGHEPGLFGPGRTWVDYLVRIGTDEGARTAWQVEIRGRFCVVVTDAADDDVPAAIWQASTADGTVVDPESLPWFEQLPRSVHVPALRGTRLRRAVARLVADGEVARGELIDSQRGLVTKVVNQFRSQLLLESRAADVDDLVQVGMQRLVDLAMRRYAGPAAARPTTAAWSKVAMREVGNAVRSEIAAVTGISIEFRQLLQWFRAHPADRHRPSAEVAFDMAVAAGVTRLLQVRQAPDRARAEALLHRLLAEGTAVYLAPGLDADAKARAREDAEFVISPRSSLAEIERAQRHGDHVALSVDAAGPDGDRSLGDRVLVAADDAFADIDLRLTVASTIASSELTPVEAAVWAARTGVFGGGADELPEIAGDLGLDGRADARAALRRAWRKLDGLTVEAVLGAA